MAFSLPLDRLHVIKLRQLPARKVELLLVYLLAIRKMFLAVFLCSDQGKVIRTGTFKVISLKSMNNRGVINGKAEWEVQEKVGEMVGVSRDCLKFLKTVCSF
jgi:hypothetical protein